MLIDRFTGEMKVTRVDLLMDLGKPINPGIDRGQVVGGFIQGMGWVTTEELCYAPDGELLSHSPTTYKIPNIGDVPPVFNVALPRQPEQHGEPQAQQSRGRAAAAAGHFGVGGGEECAVLRQRGRSPVARDPRDGRADPDRGSRATRTKLLQHKSIRSYGSKSTKIAESTKETR